jgi:hypothetical protein
LAVSPSRFSAGFGDFFSERQHGCLPQIKVRRVPVHHQHFAKF